MWKWLVVCCFGALVGCAPAGAGTRFQQLPLASNDLVLNSADGFFYAAVSERSMSWPDTVAVIDPESASVVRTIPVLGEPAQIAISEGGRYLYVLVPSQKAVQRIDLLAWQPNETITFGSDAHSTPYTPEAIGTVLGSPQSVVVSLHGTFFSSYLAVYDGVTPRPRWAEVPSGSVGTIQFSDSPGWVFATPKSGGGTGHYAVDAGGIYEASLYGIPSNYSNSREIRYRNGVVYFDSGYAYPLAGGSNGGTYNLDVFATSVFPEPEVDRVYYIHSSARHAALEIVAFYGKNRIPASRWTFPDPSTTDVTGRSLQRWGSDGLAFRTSDDRLFFVRTSALVPPALPLVDLVPPALPPVDLVVTLKANITPPRLGEQSTFTLTVTNRGTQPASDVSLHAVTSPLALGQPWAEFNVGGLAPGASKTVPWIFTPNQLPTLTTTVRATSNETEIHPADNSATYASPLAPSRKANLTTRWEALHRVHTAAGDRLQGTLVIENIGLATAKASKIRLWQTQEPAYNASYASLGVVKAPAVPGLRTVRISIDRALPRPEFSWVRARTNRTVIDSPAWTDRYTNIPAP